MLVDDSLVIRGIISRILSTDSRIKIVHSAGNGQSAIEGARKYKPHIIILDIEMPVMDGITALPKILEASPQSKVIMCSTLTEKGAEITLRAMRLGAVDCIAKPTTTTGIREESSFRNTLLQLVTGLGPKVPLAETSAPGQTGASSPAASTAKSFTLHHAPGDYTGVPSVVAVGSSTGGPKALFEVIKNFEGFHVPIVVTQHMPATFTKILAQHIQQQTGLASHEAEEGMTLEAGHVYIAQGGKHMLFEKTESGVKIKLDDGPAENFCKPAVDPMFRSLLEIYGNKILAVILTGMGHDGRDGGKMLVEKGARLIAQDEKTSVVWGMPGAVAEAGLCTSVLPLQEIGPWVRKAVKGL